MVHKWKTMVNSTFWAISLSFILFRYSHKLRLKLRGMFPCKYLLQLIFLKNWSLHKQANSFQYSVCSSRPLQCFPWRAVFGSRKMTWTSTKATLMNFRWNRTSRSPHTLLVNVAEFPWNSHLPVSSSPLATLPLFHPRVDQLPLTSWFNVIFTNCMPSFTRGTQWLWKRGVHKWSCKTSY